MYFWLRRDWRPSRSDAAIVASVAVIESGKALPSHPGVAQYGHPLHRLTDQARIANNRSVACAGFVKGNSRDRCDEYPFASTYEGAAIAGRGKVSVGHVPLPRNTTAGSRLGAKYAVDRVLDGEAYTVTVYP